MQHVEFRGFLHEFGMTTADFCEAVYHETGVCFTDGHLRSYLAKEARLSKSMSAVVRLMEKLIRERKKAHA